MKNKKRKNIIKNNQKGFSMVEILAVVVILGVLSTIGIVSVSRMIESSRRHYYDAQEDQLVLAAQSYANDNKNILPKNIGQTNTVYLDKLMEKKYIKEEIVDQNKVPCYTKDDVVNGKKVKGSRVDIYKSSKTDYTYVGHLECHACEEDNATEEGYSCSEKNKEDKPKIVIEMKKYDASTAGNSIFDSSNKIKITMDAVDKTNDGYDKTVKISSYSYKIYVDGSVKYNSGLRINNKKDQIIVADQLNKYIPGKVTVKVTVTNTLGQTVTKSKSEDYSDAKVPACSTVTYEGPNKMKKYEYSVPLSSLVCGTPNDYNWVGLNHNPSSIQGWVLCNDEYGVGCAQHEYSINMVTEGTSETLKMLDKSGNVQTCEIKKCIDKTTPKIEVKVKNGSSTKYTYTKEPSKTNGKYTTSDKNTVWLNKASFPNGVTVDVTVSDSLSKLKSYTWYMNDKEKKENSEGNATIKKDSQTWAWNANKSSYNKSINITEDGVRKIVISATDQAGNIHTYTLTLKIDRTPPPKPTISMFKEDNTSSTSRSSPYSNNTWTTKYVWVTTNHPTDNPDVSGWNRNEYTTTGTVGKKSNQKGDNIHINTEGKSTVTFQSCDNAENCSGYVTPEKTIKEDRTKPTCSIAKTDRHTTTGVTLTTTCKDDPAAGAGTSSGVKTCEGVHTGIKSDKTYTVVDNVGNSNTCSVKVYSKQRRTCNTCKRCKSAPCETYKYCQHSECGSYCCKVSFEVCLGSTCTSDTFHASCNPPPGAFNISYTYCDYSCRTSGCGCELRKRSCSDCGCESWNDWYDLNSTSCSSDGKSSDCRTRYY